MEVEGEGQMMLCLLSERVAKEKTPHPPLLFMGKRRDMMTVEEERN